jgi:hypothetical protein
MMRHEQALTVLCMLRVLLITLASIIIDVGTSVVTVLT